MQQKILLLVTLSEVGGAQKVVYYLAGRLYRKEFDVTVACAPGGELVGWLKGMASIKVIELDCLKRNISPLHDLLCLVHLYRLIKSGGYDTVHCHSSKAGLIGRLAAYLAGVRRIVFTAHGWVINDQQPLPVRWMYIWAERLAGLVSTRVVCVSENDYRKGLALKLVAANKMLVINNGAPEEVGSVAVDRVGIRRELGLNAADIVIGTVMRLAPPKQPILFLEAAKKLLEKDYSSCRFVIIGDGHLRFRCEEYIAGNNLKEKVLLPGTREDAPRLVSGFDIFTLFSSHEGLPLTIIEAMMAGVPVVASDVGGVGELVVHGETGYLVSAADIDSAVGYIKELVENPELRAKMGEAGRKRAQELFSLDRMVERYQKLYLGSL